MSDERTDLVIRDIPEWTEWFNYTQSFQFSVPLPKIGDTDRFGRTLIGFTEIDEERKRFCLEEVAFFRAELMTAYERGKFQLVGGVDEDGYQDDRWEPIETDETHYLHEQISRYQKEADAIYARPIWDRELTDE